MAFRKKKKQKAPKPVQMKEEVVVEDKFLSWITLKAARRVTLEAREVLKVYKSI